MSGTIPPSGRGTGRLALVAGGALAAASALSRRAWSLLPDGTTGSAAGLPVDHLVELTVVTAGALAAAWLAASALIALTCVVAARLGRRWHAGWAVLDRVAPGMVRRLARSAVGIGVGTGLALAPTAALAADTDVATPGQAPPAVSTVLDLGWQTTTLDAESTPETAEEDTTPADADDTPRATAAEATTTEATTTVARTIRAAPSPDDGTVVVLRGDTLWDLAADHLGGSPSDADVLREVVRWHDANRDVIGADPDVILPGQVLEAPDRPTL